MNDGRFLSHVDISEDDEESIEKLERDRLWEKLWTLNNKID